MSTAEVGAKGSSSTVMGEDVGTTIVELKPLRLDDGAVEYMDVSPEVS